MPVWTPTEIVALNMISRKFTEDELINRLAICGPIPRDVFLQTFSGKADIETKVAECTPEKIIEFILSGNVLPSDKTFSHKLVHIYSISPFLGCNARIEFASEFVGRLIYEKTRSNVEKNIIDVINQLKGKTLSSSIRGMLFEQYAHDVLCRGVESGYSVRSLESEDNPEHILSCDVCTLVKHFHKADQIRDPDTYYIPISDNQAAYDSVGHGKAFQMTVSDKHGVKYLPLNELRKNLKLQMLHLYFVVPADKYESFPKQPYLTTKKKTYKKEVFNIQQFVLCMKVVNF